MKYAQAYVQQALHNNLILQKKQKTTKIFTNVSL